MTGYYEEISCVNGVTLDHTLTCTQQSIKTRQKVTTRNNILQ